MLVGFSICSLVRLCANTPERLPANMNAAADLTLLLGSILLCGVIASGVEEFILYPLMILTILVDACAWLLPIWFINRG
jgi:hypothetical protein